MARIAGINIPQNKVVSIALTYIHGIGLHSSKKICKKLDIPIKWKGKGINEKCFDLNNNIIVECNKKYFRPSEVDTLLGNSSKARKKLKWRPKISIKELVSEMVEKDLKYLTNENHEKK